MKKKLQKILCLFNRSCSSTDETPLLNGNFVRASIEMKIVTRCHCVRYIGHRLFVSDRRDDFLTFYKEMHTRIIAAMFVK